MRLIAFAAPLIPFLAVAMSPRHPPGTRPPLWPLPAAVGACAFGWVGGGFAWLAIGRPLIEASWTALQATAAAPPTLAALALPLGIAAQFWWRALRDRGAPRFDGTGMFADVVTATMTGLLIGLVLVFAVVLPLSPAVMRFKAPVLAAWLIVPTAAAWLGALWRIRRMEPTTSHGPVIAIAVMLVAIPLSFAPPLVLLDTADWAELFLLLATPFTVAAFAIVLLVVPRVVAIALHVSPTAWAGSIMPKC